jgi:Na+-transporting methylmalonyl-CoA/oxaloacetate decarboxylase gamma subunit
MKLIFGGIGIVILILLVVVCVYTTGGESKTATGYPTSDNAG